MPMHEQIVGADALRYIILKFKAKNEHFSHFIHSRPIAYIAKTTQISVIFCISKYQVKMGEFAASIERSKAKSVSASRGASPQP